jgi:hypothetical protein
MFDNIMAQHPNAATATRAAPACLLGISWSLTDGMRRPTACSSSQEAYVFVGLCAVTKQRPAAPDPDVREHIAADLAL